jgi:hypothetical protein
MTRAPSRSASESGNLIWTVTEAAGPEGVVPEILWDETGLTRGQCERGKVFIREHKATDEGKSFIRVGNTYIVTTEASECARSVCAVLKAVDTRLRRLYKSEIQPLGSNADIDPALRFYAAHLKAMFETFDVMAETGYSTAARLIRTGRK